MCVHWNYLGCQLKNMQTFHFNIREVCATSQMLIHGGSWWVTITEESSLSASPVSWGCLLPKGQSMLTWAYLNIQNNVAALFFGELRNNIKHFYLYDTEHNLVSSWSQSSCPWPCYHLKGQDYAKEGHRDAAGEGPLLAAHCAHLCLWQIVSTSLKSNLINTSEATHLHM
jgi:hypothetical protein